MPNPARLIALMGGPRHISELLGIHESAVSRWPERGVPPGHALAILKAASRKAEIAKKTHTLVECRTGKLYGANVFMRQVKKALGVKLCAACNQPLP